MRRKITEMLVREKTNLIDWYNRRKTPLYLVPEIAALKFSGGTIKDYGGPGLTNVELGSVCYEFARNDASIGTFCGVHTLLGMATINFLADEEQKKRLFADCMNMDKILCFCLTEP